MSFTNRGSKESFSFHCVICYEFLSPHERPPVVLPCGHTYVCEQCAKRLDKCMECREPLKRAFPKQHVAPPKLEEIRGWRDVQRNRQQQNQRQLRANYDVLTPQKTQLPTVETSITLPTPRNLVLVSLIESVMLAHKDELENDDKGYESGDDDEFVRQGIRVLGSTCGTYVVRDANGITVFDQPTKTLEVGSEEEDQPKEVRKLVCGQTVQILSLEDGVATVGRGGGYIHVGTSKQLVKVGEPLDKACTLQTSHKLVTQEVAALEARLLHARMAEQRLADKVLEALAAPENSDPFGPEPEPEVPSPVLQTPPTRVEDTATRLLDYSSYSPLLPTLEGQENLQVSNHPDSLLNFGASHHYFNDPIAIRATQSLEEHRDHFSEDDDNISTQSVGVIEAARNSLRYESASAADDDIAVAFGCGDILPLSFLGTLTSCNGRRRIRRRGDTPSFVDHNPRIPSTMADNRVMAAAATAAAVVEGMRQQDMHNQHRVTVNWATGLSGHSGLSQAAKPNNQAGTPLRNVRMMSEHRGAAHIGPFSKGFSTTFSATSW